MQASQLIEELLALAGKPSPAGAVLNLQLYNPSARHEYDR